MTSFLKKVFGCCITDQHIDESNNSIIENVESDIIYIAVPRSEFGEYFVNVHQDLKLDLVSFMALYKYATDELVPHPGLGYMYEKFVLLVDGEYLRVEGWVPVPKLDLSWCHEDENQESTANTEVVVAKPPMDKPMDKPRKGDVLCVGIPGKVTREEMLLGIKEKDIYTGKPLLLPASQRGKMFTYSRHMNDSLNCRELADCLRKLGYGRKY